MAEKYLSHPSVRHVTARLTDIGHPHQVIALADTARSAQEAAAALGVEVGAIVKTLMFVHGDDDVPVIALIAGDRQCDAAALAARVGSSVACRRPDAARVKAATAMPLAVSRRLVFRTACLSSLTSLFRFAAIWSAAGHPHCVFRHAAAASGAVRRRSAMTSPPVADRLEPPAPAPISIASDNRGTRPARPA